MKTTATTTVKAALRPQRRATTKAAEVVDSHDWQLTKTRPHVLATVIHPIIFDPTNKGHRDAFAHFLVNKKWPEHIRFLEEHPFTSAVTTAQQKMVEYALRSEISAVLATNQALAKASVKTNKESK